MEWHKEDGKRKSLIGVNQAKALASAEETNAVNARTKLVKTAGKVVKEMFGTAGIE